MLLGMPVNESESAPNTFTTGQYLGMLGDFSHYWIADTLDMIVQRPVELTLHRIRKVLSCARSSWSHTSLSRTQSV
jgi:hypothetical protein